MNLNFRAKNGWIDLNFSTNSTNIENFEFSRQNLNFKNTRAKSFGSKNKWRIISRFESLNFRAQIIPGLGSRDVTFAIFAQTAMKSEHGNGDQNVFTSVADIIVFLSVDKLFSAIFILKLGFESHGGFALRVENVQGIGFGYKRDLKLDFNFKIYGL